MITKLHKLVCFFSFCPHLVLRSNMVRYHAKKTYPFMEDKTLHFINKRRIMMYRQMINFIELMVVSLMALVATSISMLTWYQVVGMFFAAVIMLFIGIELECGESKKEEL